MSTTAPASLDWSKRTTEQEQHSAAKVVGWVYLIAMATSMFAEFFTRAPLIVSGDGIQTAINIAEHQQMFRIGSVIHLLTFASDAVIAVALYVILSPVSRHVALLAAFWRLADSAILSVNILNDFAILRFLSDAEYLKSIDPKQLQALARLTYSVAGAGFQIGFVFLGLGSTVFAWLWLKSGYVPKGFAVLGIFASLMLAFGTVAIMLFPALNVVGMSYMAPMFFFEVGLGLWLLIKGLRVPAAQ